MAPRRPPAESAPGAQEDPFEELSGGGESARPLETLFQEILRRGASLGFASFFMTEEAIRRAFSDRVPAEWVEYLSRQGEEMRTDLVDRVGAEFGEWLRTLDVAKLLGELLDSHDVRARIELSAEPRGADGAGTGLQVELVRRK